MSRKSKRNPPDPASPQPPAAAAPPHSQMKRRAIFIAALVALLLAFIAAALHYKGERAQASQGAAALSQPALLSAHAPGVGPAGAKVHIVEFLDPACETCAVFFSHVEEMLEAHPGQIRLSLRHVPFHRGSDLAVKALEASRKQGKYLVTLKALYAAQARWVVNHQVQPDGLWRALGGLGLDLDRLGADMSDPELAQRMAQDMADAKALGVTKTPEFFVNGRPLPSFGLAPLQALVRDELSRAYP